jgi:replication factor A1
MDVKNLNDGMKRVEVTVRVMSIGDIREVKSKFKDEVYRIADAVVADMTGQIKLTLWGDQIAIVAVGDILHITNAYVTSFKSEVQLNVGKFGKIEKLQA